MKRVATACLIAASLVGLAAQEIYKVGNGVSAPVVLKEVKPDYTEEAKRAHVEGNVVLQIVVTAAGDVTDVKVARSLDDTFGLDKQAVAAAKQWKFKPAMKEGKAVAVQVMVELWFTLK